MIGFDHKGLQLEWCVSVCVKNFTPAPKTLKKTLNFLELFAGCSSFYRG